MQKGAHGEHLCVIEKWLTSFKGRKKGLRIIKSHTMSMSCHLERIVNIFVSFEDEGQVLKEQN